MNAILYPTDFSEGANYALSFARGLSKLADAKLFYFNVYHVPVVSPLPPDMHESMKEEAERKSIERLDALRQQAPDIESGTISKLGLGVDEIVDTAAGIDAGMIVMGTKGATGLKEVVLGSITGDVIEQVKCPVLAVPEGLEYKGFNNILFATDFEEVELPSIQQLKQFADLHDAQIHLLHVFFITLPDDPVNQEKIKKFRQMLKDHDLYERIVYHYVYAEDVNEGIDEFVKQHDIDLIAMLMHRRNFFQKLFSPSHTKRMAYHSKVPLLAFHE